MKTRLNQYRVYRTATGELAASGTADECAAQMGVKPGYFRQMAAKGHAKYKIEAIKPEKVQTQETRELAKGWDAEVLRWCLERGIEPRVKV